MVLNPDSTLDMEKEEEKGVEDEKVVIKHNGKVERTGRKKGARGR